MKKINLNVAMNKNSACATCACATCALSRNSEFKCCEYQWYDRCMFCNGENKKEQCFYEYKMPKEKGVYKINLDYIS